MNLLVHWTHLTQYITRDRGRHPSREAGEPVGFDRGWRKRAGFSAYASLKRKCHSAVRLPVEGQTRPGEAEAGSSAGYRDLVTVRLPVEGLTRPADWAEAWSSSDSYPRLKPQPELEGHLASDDLAPCGIISPFQNSMPWCNICCTKIPHNLNHELCVMVEKYNLLYCIPAMYVIYTSSSNILYSIVSILKYIICKDAT